MRDELKEGDQILVKVLAVEGNRIRLSRKAILKEQRAKMGGGEAPAPVGTSTMTIEGGTAESDEPNYNRDGPGGRPHGGRPHDGGRPGGGGGGGGRRRRGGGGGGGGRGPRR